MLIAVAADGICPDTVIGVPEAKEIVRAAVHTLGVTASAFSARPRDSRGAVAVNRGCGAELSAGYIDRGVVESGG